MALNPVSTGNTILAFDVNQLVQVLQRLTGQTETGKWFLAGNAYTNNAALSLYIPTLSRGATPASLSIDTTDQAPTGGFGTASTNNLTANGFQVYCANTTGPNSNCRAGGNWTVTF